jgi:hypothetical protein
VTRILLAALVLLALATYKLRRDAAVWHSYPYDFPCSTTTNIRYPHTGVRDPHLERLR